MSSLQPSSSSSSIKELTIGKLEDKPADFLNINSPDVEQPKALPSNSCFGVIFGASCKDASSQYSQKELEHVSENEMDSESEKYYSCSEGDESSVDESSGGESSGGESSGGESSGGESSGDECYQSGKLGLGSNQAQERHASLQEYISNPDEHSFLGMNVSKYLECHKFTNDEGLIDDQSLRADLDRFSKDNAAKIMTKLFMRYRSRHFYLNTIPTLASLVNFSKAYFEYNLPQFSKADFMCVSACVWTCAGVLLHNIEDGLTPPRSRSFRALFANISPSGDSFKDLFPFRFRQPPQVCADPNDSGMKVHSTHVEDAAVDDLCSCRRQPLRGRSFRCPKCADFSTNSRIKYYSFNGTDSSLNTQSNFRSINLLSISFNVPLSDEIADPDKAASSSVADELSQRLGRYLDEELCLETMINVNIMHKENTIRCGTTITTTKIKEADISRHFPCSRKVFAMTGTQLLPLEGILHGVRVRAYVERQWQYLGGGFVVTPSIVFTGNNSLFEQNLFGVLRNLFPNNSSDRAEKPIIGKILHRLSLCGETGVDFVFRHRDFKLVPSECRFKFLEVHIKMKSATGKIDMGNLEKCLDMFTNSGARSFVKSASKQIGDSEASKYFRDSLGSLFKLNEVQPLSELCYSIASKALTSEEDVEKLPIPDKCKSYLREFSDFA